MRPLLRAPPVRATVCATSAAEHALRLGRGAQPPAVRPHVAPKCMGRLHRLGPAATREDWQAAEREQQLYSANCIPQTERQTDGRTGAHNPRRASWNSSSRLRGAHLSGKHLPAAGDNGCSCIQSSGCIWLHLVAVTLCCSPALSTGSRRGRTRSPSERAALGPDLSHWEATIWGSKMGARIWRL